MRLGAPRVLVVDDHELSRLLVREVLSLAEIEVTGASTLAEARRSLELARPAAIVLDLHLPDGHGVELARSVRSDPRTAGCAIIACSAADRDSVDGLSWFDDYVPKPIDPQRFCAIVGGLLGGRPAPRLQASPAA